MGVKRVKQANQVVGGNKEAPIAVGNSGLSNQQQEQFFKPKDVEYQHYQELLQGYFEKFARWQEIFRNEQYSVPEEDQFTVVLRREGGIDFIERIKAKWTSEIEIVKSPTGSEIRPIHVIRPLMPFYEPTSNAILHGEMSYVKKQPNKDGEPERLTIDTHFEPVLEGIVLRRQPSATIGRKQLLVDLDGEPILHTRILISENRPEQVQSLHIRTEIPGKTRGTYETRNVHYAIKAGELSITRGYSSSSYNKPMSDTYAIHLFNIIDALFPGTTITSQQPERRARQETQTPKSLPPARRRSGKN